MNKKEIEEKKKKLGRFFFVIKRIWGSSPQKNSLPKDQFVYSLRSRIQSIRQTSFYFVLQIAYQLINTRNFINILQSAENAELIMNREPHCGCRIINYVELILLRSFTFVY